MCKYEHIDCSFARQQQQQQQQRHLEIGWIRTCTHVNNVDCIHAHSFAYFKVWPRYVLIASILCAIQPIRRVARLFSLSIFAIIIGGQWVCMEQPNIVHTMQRTPTINSFSSHRSGASLVHTVSGEMQYEKCVFLFRCPWCIRICYKTTEQTTIRFGVMRKLLAIFFFFCMKQQKRRK